MGPEGKRLELMLFVLFGQETGSRSFVLSFWVFLMKLLSLQLSDLDTKAEWVETPLQLLEVYAENHAGIPAFLSGRLGVFSSTHMHTCMHTDISPSATVEAAELRVWMQSEGTLSKCLTVWEGHCDAEAPDLLYSLYSGPLYRAASYRKEPKPLLN